MGCKPHSIHLSFFRENWKRISLSWKVLLFPLVLLPLLALGSGMGLIVGLIGVVLEDVKKVINFIMGLLMWITPVVYSAKLDSPIIQAIIPWNPLTYLVSSARDIVITGIKSSYTIH